MGAEQWTVGRRSPAAGFVLGAAVLATVIIGGVSGCSAQVDLPAYVATYEPEGSGGSAAVLDGDLVRSDDCLILVDTEGVTWVPVFPRHASVTADRSIQVGSASYTLGSNVSLPGGESVDSEGFHIPSGCPGDVAVWVVAA